MVTFVEATSRAPLRCTTILRAVRRIGERGDAEVIVDAGALGRRSAQGVWA
jgi:hypothetical protein